MSRNDAQDFAERLYARVPGNYRVYDQEQGRPLLALLTVVAEQVANIRGDLDALWDNFFIETCQEWVVPYVGALTGTNLLANPVGHSNRLEVRDTVLWRRSKGTPEMLRKLATEISGWPCDFAEFFRSLGWSQNLNHLRPERALTVDLRDSYHLSLLGQGADPFAHAADFKPAFDLDQARITRDSLGIGKAAWGTPGRYQIRNLGFFARRLQVFPVTGATPAAVDPGFMTPPNASCYTFDPLHREMPLFVHSTAAPLTRAAFDATPWQFLGVDVAVEQFGIPLAAPAIQPDFSSSRTPFTFGGATGKLALDPAVGIRLPEQHRLKLGAVHFIIEALWESGGASTSLGALSTLHADLDDWQAYSPGSTASGAGQLAITVELGRTAFGWNIPDSPAAGFPGVVIAVRRASASAPQLADALYVYLPPRYLTPGVKLTCYVADDGSAYSAPDLDAIALMRAGEGQVYPPAVPTTSDAPASDFRLINRMPGALRIVDPSRFGNLGVLIQAELFTGIFQAQGAIATQTIPNAVAAYPSLKVPNTWPGFSFAPSSNAFSNNLPDTGLLTILLQPLAGNFVPASELIVTNRGGEALLIYLPEITNCPAAGMRVLVAEDGSTRFAPTNLQQIPGLLEGFLLARGATGQALPIGGLWPIQYRRPVAINLCRPERAALLHLGELGIDPELGNFAFPSGDPIVGQGGLSVDYVEALAGPIGALNYDRMLDPRQPGTRFVSKSGDSNSPLTSDLNGAPIHSSVADAVAAAVEGDVIEILDSATYFATDAIGLVNPAIMNLAIRAASGQRPCLTFYRAPGQPTYASFLVTAAMNSLALNGLLISGGPLTIESKISSLQLEACTLDPRLGDSILAFDSNLNDRANYLLCRCIAGGLRMGAGVAQLTIADSIVERQQGVAIAGLGGAASPPLSPANPPIFASPPRFGSPPGSTSSSAPSVQLERVTVLGRIYCGVLSASESILDALAIVEDQQSGCVRFTRYEIGSILPRRYQCVPSEAQAATCTSSGRCFAPLFNSRRFGRPDYAQLAAACPAEILSASEQSSEIGAFDINLNTIRLVNLKTKLREFMPIGLRAVIIAST